MHLLIAEPDTWLLETYRDFFAREGFRVSTASTGPRCLETLKQTPPDALILEPELPCGLGQTILQLIRESRAIGEVPVVVLTRHRGPGRSSQPSSPLLHTTSNLIHWRNLPTPFATQLTLQQSERPRCET